MLPTVHPGSVGRNHWPHTVVVSRSDPCRALMGEGFQRAGGLGLLAALTLQRAGAHTFLPFEEGRSNGVCARTRQQGEEAAGPLRRDSAWVYLVTFRVPFQSITPTQVLLQCLRAVGWHPQHVWCPQHCCYLFPARSRGFIEEVSCLLLLPLL